MCRRQPFNQTLGRSVQGQPVKLPQQGMRVTVKDPAGQVLEIPVSPARHHPSDRLERSYVEEFSLGLVNVNNRLHRADSVKT